VEYFLTENLLGHFNQILQQRSNRRGNVAMQVRAGCWCWCSVSPPQHVQRV